jgi:ankyrin repeat protein
VSLICERFSLVLRTILACAANDFTVSHQTNSLPGNEMYVARLKKFSHQKGRQTFLLDYGAELTIHSALLHAIDSNFLDMVQLLVEREAPVNVVSSETPLTRAIRRGYLDIAKYLIESGADVNLADKNGNFPIEVCVEKLNSEMMQENL